MQLFYSPSQYLLFSWGASFTMFALQQYLNGFPAWANAPWGTIVFGLSAVLAGHALADVKYPDSWLRQILSEQRKLFHVESVIPRYRATPAEEWYELTASIRFLRHVKDASVIMHVNGMYEGSVKITDTVILEKNTSFLKGENPLFVLATIPKGNSHASRSCWGPPGTESKQVFSPLPCTITLEVRGDNHTQCYSVFFKMFDDGGTGGRFYFMGENYKPFTDIGHQYAA